MSIEEVLKRHEAKLLSLPNVTGTGIGEKKGKKAIIVFVKRKVPLSQLKPEEIIPREIEGYETDVMIELKIGRHE